MKRVLRIAAIVLLALVLLLAGAWWWLTGTASGASFLLGQVESRVETLEYRDVEGGLSSGLSLAAVRFAQGDLEVTADGLELAVDLDLFPLTVHVERLHLREAVVNLPPGGEPEPAAEPFRPGDYSAPLPIDVGSLIVDGLTLVTAGEAEPTVVERIELAGRYAEALRIRALSIEMAPYRLTASGRLGLSAPWPADLEAGLDWQLAPNQSQRLDIALGGQLNALEIEVEGRGPLAAEAGAELRGLPDPDALNGQITASGRLQDWPELPGRFDEVRIEAEGSLEDWRAEVDGRVMWPDQPTVELSLAAEGREDSIRIERGVFELLDGRIDVTGQAALGDPLTANAAIRLEALDFTSLYPDWPSQAAVSGGFDAGFDGRELTIEELALRAPPAALEVNGGGRFDIENQALDVVLEWASLNWPPVLELAESGTGSAPEPLFSSESGRFEGSGTLDDWRAEVEAWLTAPEQPRARLELQADGDLEQAFLRSGRVRLDDGGSIALSGRIGYAGAPTGELDLILDTLDPAALVPELPGAVDGDIGVTLSATEPLSVGVDIRRLDGTLRSQPLAGSGALQVAGALVERADLELSLGANRVDLDTRDGSDWQIVIAAERLGQLWPGLTGGLRGSATFEPPERQLTWSIESDGMGWTDKRLASMNSTGTAHWGERPNVDARIQAADVDLNPWERLDSLSLTLSGDCTAHQLDAAFTGMHAEMDFMLTGSLAGCLRATEGWAGVVRELTFAETPLGQWQLDQNLPIQVRDGVVTVGAGCLWTPADSGRLCLNELRAGEDGAATVAFNSVPLDLLLLPMDPVFTLGNRLRGVVEFGWDAGGVRDLDAELLLGPGAVRMLGADEDLLAIRGARLGLQSPEPRALDATLELGLESRSELRAQASIPDLSDPSAMRLDADANLSLPNLAVLNRLVPQLDDMSGSLEGRFELAGPLQALAFDGRIAIQDGGFFHAPLGSRVEQLQLVLEGTETGGTLNGSFMAGDGRASVDGSLDAAAADGWEGRIALAGDRLQFFDVDWLQLTASPDLELAYFPDRLEVDGGVTIDRARLGLPPGSTQRVPASSDVVVAGRETGGDNEQEAPPVRDIVGSIALSLSDDVQMSAAGMQTAIAGDLDLEWEKDKALPSARGALELIDGSYSAYGQNLEVTQGEVLFTGNPIDNPVLDIEAVRQIFGDPEVEEAGVRIRGPARTAEISLFTDPPTNREKALAYILTGAEFDHAAGQGAFNVGFWVLPKLFVSYGVGLFDTGNVLAARYDLSRRWGVKATSGESDTGVDVSFIIDR